MPLVPDGAPMIYDAQNGEGALKAEMYRPTPAGRALAQAVCDIETETVRRSLLVTAASATDLALLAGLTPTMAPFELVPNGCDAQAVNYVEGRERIARREAYLLRTHGQGLAPHTRFLAVFVGSAHPPNIEAAAQLVRVADQLPHVLLVLVGSHAAQLDRTRTPLPENVIAAGVVSDQQLGLVLSACDVALNPISSGSGTNIKMLDYFAAGAPVIATEVGARGLGATSGTEYAATDVGDVAEVIDDVISDPTAAARRARLARQIAERLDWAVDRRGLRPDGAVGRRHLVVARASR